MQRRGFTLLELIVVLTILGFLAAMVLPRVGRMSTAERIKLTQDRLEQVRAAIVGPRYVFDEHGQPKIGGYVGDVGALPELVRGYLSDGKNKEWHDDGAANGDFESGFDHDSGSMQWVWDFTAPSDYDASADWTIDGLLLNHPGGLFEDPGIDGWQGPYCGPGKDIYRNDHSAYAETVKAGDVGDTRAWAMRITTNRLDDAWGRSLLFWLEDVGADGDPTNDSLWIISEGSDQKSEWIAGEYQPNKDKDLYVIITANEWYVPLEDLTLQRMELIRTAIVGPRNRFDAQGRIAIGGYVREHGHLPDDLDAIATMDMVQLGSDWRSDAWGNQFTITPDHDEGTLIVASAGPTADAGDDLEMVIGNSWRAVFIQETRERLVILKNAIEAYAEDHGQLPPLVEYQTVADKEPADFDYDMTPLDHDAVLPADGDGAPLVVPLALWRRTWDDGISPVPPDDEYLASVAWRQPYCRRYGDTMAGIPLEWVPEDAFRRPIRFELDHLSGRRQMTIISEGPDRASAWDVGHRHDSGHADALDDIDDFLIDDPGRLATAPTTWACVATGVTVQNITPEPTDVYRIAIMGTRIDPSPLSEPLVGVADDPSTPLVHEGMATWTNAGPTEQRPFPSNLSNSTEAAVLDADGNVLPFYLVIWKEADATAPDNQQCNTATERKNAYVRRLPITWNGTDTLTVSSFTIDCSGHSF